MAFESLLLDARGNAYQGALDAIGGETLVDARVASATLSALNAEIVIDLNGKATASFDIRATAANLTLVFEATLDGVNYFTLPAWMQTQTLAATTTGEFFAPQLAITTTATALATVGVTGFRRVRVRVSAFTSGAVVVAARAQQAALIIYARPVPSTLWITAAAAANTLTTATLPAAGVGMYHYITSIEITRASSAAVAGTATLNHTATNLPSSPVWTVGNAIAAGGTEKDVKLEFGTSPLKSSVANTATTITAAAAGAGVIGRVNVSYYVGS